MSRMHRNIVVAAALLLLCSLHPTHTAQGAEAVPIAPDIVREGDFALALVEVLGIGQAASEAEAESLLTSHGIVPPRGWIADYPVTPDVLRDLEMDIATAADAGLLRMSRGDALGSLAELTAELGLPTRVPADGKHGMVPSGSEGEGAPDSFEVKDYYAEEGPPIITYLPPPYDYGYLYDWVPYSFYWFGFTFPGYYILHDFHSVRNVVIYKRLGRHAVHGRHGAYRVYGHRNVSNHVIDPETGRFTIVQPGSRILRQLPAGSIDKTGRSRFLSEEARRGARSILRRDLVRESRIGGSRQGLTGEGPQPGLLRGMKSSEVRPLPPTAGTGFTSERNRMEDGGLSSPGFRSSVSRPPLSSPTQSREGFSAGGQGRDGIRGLNRSSGFGFGSGRDLSSGRGGLSGSSFRDSSRGAAGTVFRSGGGVSSRGFSGGGFSGGNPHGAGGFSGGGGRGGGGFSGGGFRGR